MQSGWILGCRVRPGSRSWWEWCRTVGGVTRFLGVDLASQPAGTGVVVLDVRATGFAKVVLAGDADDDELVRLAAGVEVVGVDCPLGWPRPFVAAVVAHDGLAQWPGGVDRSVLTHRTTDLFFKGSKAANPLSVSADKLGSTAMRCALLQHRWAREVWGHRAPRDGSGELVEVYPAAALRAWAIPTDGYKGRSGAKTPAGRVARGLIVEHLKEETGAWLDLSEVERRASIRIMCLTPWCRRWSRSPRSEVTRPGRRPNRWKRR